MEKICEVDWARLAMAIDTDGGISIDKGTLRNGAPKYLLDIYLVNSDMRLLDWTKSLFGGFISHHKPKNPKWKQVYHWATKGKSAYKILIEIRKFLIIKQERADIGILFWERCTRLTRNLGRNGRSEWMVKRQEEYYLKITALNKRGVETDEVPASSATSLGDINQNGIINNRR